MHQNYFTAIYKLTMRLNACTFVSRTEKYRTRSERTFGSKRTVRSVRTLEPWLHCIGLKQDWPMDGIAVPGCSIHIDIVYCILCCILTL